LFNKKSELPFEVSYVESGNTDFTVSIAQYGISGVTVSLKDDTLLNLSEIFSVTKECTSGFIDIQICLLLKTLLLA